MTNKHIWIINCGLFCGLLISCAITFYLFKNKSPLTVDSYPLLQSNNIPNKTTQDQLKEMAQYAALSSHCICQPRPHPCLTNWNRCTQSLDDLNVLKPSLTSNTRVLYNFSTYSSSPLVGGEGIVASTPNGNGLRLIIGFAGSTVAIDWFNDFRFWMTQFRPLGDWTSRKGDAVLLKVHKGMFDIYTSMRSVLVDLLNRVFESGGQGDMVNEVVVVGHSLAGVLATFLLFDLRFCQLINGKGSVIERMFRFQSVKSTNDQMKSKCPIKIPSHINLSLFSYGQPKVGNTEFVNYLQGMLDSDELQSKVQIYRVMNSQDIVPTLPPHLTGYRHLPGDYYAYDIENPSSNQPFINCKSRNDEKVDDESELLDSCKLRFPTSSGHNTYIWNFDNVKFTCRKI